MGGAGVVAAASGLMALMMSAAYVSMLSRLLWVPLPLPPEEDDDPEVVEPDDDDEELGAPACTLSVMVGVRAVSICSIVCNTAVDTLAVDRAE